MRFLTPEAEAAAGADHVLRTVAVALDFGSGMVRLNGSPGNIVIGLDEFLGVGQLGSISAIEESAALQSYGLTVALSGIPRDSVNLALTQTYQGRRGTVWDVLMNTTTWQVIADPVILFRGRMDTMSVTLGDTAVATVRLENRLSDWARPRMSRYSAEDQEKKFPGDEGLRFAAALESKSVIWPARGWFSKPRGSSTPEAGVGSYIGSI